jgi:hypothetical protein
VTIAIAGNTRAIAAADALETDADLLVAWNDATEQ